MERSIMVEENHHTSDSDLVSKSVGSSIKIDSISIDLVSNNENDARKCEHFSIRGYVSEIRKKNWKNCWPFALDDNHHKFEEQACTLPPLPVSKFRWWRCQNCLQEIGAESIKYNNGNAFNYCSSARFKSGGTCSHTSSLAPVQQLDFHQGPKLNILDRTIVDASTATNLNDDDFHPSSCTDKKEKKSESADNPIIEHEIVSEDNTSLDIPESAGAATGGISGMMTAGSNHADDTEALKANCNGSVELGQLSHGSYENTEVEQLSDQNLKTVAKNSSGLCQTGIQPSAEVEHLNVVVSCGTSEVNGMVNDVIDAVKSTNKHPCLGFDDYDNASSESAETLPGNDPEDHHDNSSGSHRRKTRKVRLLTELLAENGDASTNLPRDEKFSSNSAPDASAEVAAPSTPQCPVAVQGNVLRVFDQNRKRKFLRDEEWRPVEVSSQNNFNKRDRTCNEGAETVSRLASADSEEDAGTGLQIGEKSQLNKFRLVRSPTMSKKKNKKGQFVDEFLSLAVPCQEHVQKEYQNEAGDVSVANTVFSGSRHTTFTSRGMHPFPLPQKTERNSSLCKKKSKMPLVDDGQASLIPWSNGLLRGSPLTRKDIEITQMPSLTAPFQSAQDVSNEKGPHLSLNSCLSTEGYDRRYISPLEDCLFLWQGGISKENQVTGKDSQTNYTGDSYFPSKSEPDAYQRKVNCDLSSNTLRTSFLNDKQKSISQAETGSCSLMQQMDFCGRNNNMKSTETLEHSALPKKHCAQRADKVSEQGIIDDIPMEIVELMAKNQYERCLPDVENDNRQSETTINTSNAEIYAKGKFNFLLEETAQKPKPRAKSSKNGKITRVGSVGSTKKKSVDCFSHVNREHINIHQLEPTSAPTEFRAFPHCQERLPSGVKFSDTSFSKHGSSQNCQWIGNILGHRSSQTNLQTLGACNTCQSVPRQNKEAAHLWSSMMPNHMPFLYNFAQKHADPSSNIDAFPHYPNSLRKGNLNGNHGINFLNLNATSTEKQNRNSDSENVSRPQAEYPLACKHSRMGSLDLYSNETIPAMHLLSLMDAGLRSGAPIDIDGTPKFHKKPSFLHDHHSKDVSGMSSGGYKTSSTMKPPLYDYYGKNHLPENSHEYITGMSTVGASGFSFHHDKGVKKTTGFTGQASLRSQEKEKTKGSDSPSKNKSHRSQKSVLTTGGSSTNHGSIPFNMQKMFLGTSDSMAFPLQCHVVENASKRKLEACNTTSGILPLKSSSKTEKCSVNRNPADFSTPEARNIYMIRGEDLKFRKPVFSDNRSGLIKLDRRKRQRKLTAAKGKV
ncbi:protein EMBRYONIC FLOWER 1 isoform X2 [Pistacia vera]|uniref:protein EMBRYONIC FLOWER 1 isoform X2 n=1 Tax=Pistacia vera TaxID=55513 RepID=UPI001263D7E9|nr:protein EMBRYONIC FLOWER 1 isoform X2 [Pistacia vera]